MSKRSRELPEWSVVVPIDARHEKTIVYDSDYPKPDDAAAAMGPMRLRFDGSSLGPCVIEYSEKHPPFCLKPGMASDFVLFSPPPPAVDDSPGTQGTQGILEQQLQGQPFLGDCVKPQLAMINPLFKTPLFSREVACSECEMVQAERWCCDRAFCDDCWRSEHSSSQSHLENGHSPSPPSPVQTTDFLILHGRILTPIRQVFVAGQQEPQSHTPSGKEQVVPHVKMTHDEKHFPHGNLTCYSEQEMMLAIGIAKFGTANQGREITFEQLARAVLSRFSRTDPSRKNLRKMFKQLVYGTSSRLAMMTTTATATATNTNNKLIWTGGIPEYSVENLTRLISPENVCLIESTLRAEYRLRQLGIFRALKVKDITRYLNRLLKLRDFKVKRASYLVEKDCPKLFDYLVDDIVSVDRRIDIVNFILRQVINAPWNTTEAFVRARVHGTPLDIQSPMSPDFFAFIAAAAAADESGVLKKKKKTDDEAVFRKRCNAAWQRQSLALSNKAPAAAEAAAAEAAPQGDRRPAIVRDIETEFNQPCRSLEREQNDLVALRRDLGATASAAPAALAPAAAAPAPTKVVRRVTRTVYEDGTEVVRFEFLTSLREVNATMQRMQKTKPRLEKMI